MKSSHVLAAACCLIAVLLLVGGCDSDAWGGHDERIVTGITEVRVEPNPVAAGDTTLFTCVITDPASNFTFSWSIPNSVAVETDINQYHWIAPSKPDTYLHQVRAIEKAGTGRPAQYQFEVTVIPKPASSE